MRFTVCKRVLANVCRDIPRNHTGVFAAALAYYCVLALFPSLLLLAAVLAYLPVPDLFPRLLDVMSKIVPAESMGMVRQITGSIISPYRGALLSFGIVGVLWSVTTGFTCLIEALDVAYDVPETRAFWKTRLVAAGMALGVGGLLLVALTVQIAGPNFGHWLARNFGLGPVLRVLWPYLRWVTTAVFVGTAVTATYKVAPNIRQRISQILPGAVFAAGFWILLSYGMGIYLRSFSRFNKIYGTLGAAAALMVWFYYTSYVILLGAELNSAMIHQLGGTLELKEQPPQAQPEGEPGVAA